MDRIPIPEEAGKTGYDEEYYDDEYYDGALYEEEFPEAESNDEDLYEEEETVPAPEPVRTRPVDEVEIGTEEPLPTVEVVGYVPEPEVAPVPSGGETAGSGRSVSYFGVKSASLFRIYETMPCSLCFGEIAEGLQAIRCSCGDISHLACGIRAGACPDCGADYQELMDKASEEAILRSVEDSRQSA